MVLPLWKTVRQFLKQIKNATAIGSSKPTLNICLKEFKVGSGREVCNTHAHSNIIHDSQKIRSTRESINRQLNKMWHVHIYPCSELLFNLKRKGNSAICYNMDESGGIMLNEVSQS